MQSAKKKKDELAGIINAITDERVRYFYLMLGEALGEATAENNVVAQANTSPAHVAGLAARLNGN